MQLSPEDLARIATVTLAHYNQHADGFWEGTRDHDVSQNIAALSMAKCAMGSTPAYPLTVFRWIGGSTPAASKQDLANARAIR